MTGQRKATYLIQRSTGKRIKLGSVLPSSNLPPRLKRQPSPNLAPSALPAVVDLRPHFPPVWEHYTLNSAVADAIASSYQYLQTRLYPELTAEEMSALFLYYNARVLENQEETDQGCSLAAGLETLAKTGICREETWSYDSEMIIQKPHFAAYKEAKNYQLEQVQEIDLELLKMKRCLAQGYPFLFTLQLFHSFNHAGHEGEVLTPDHNEENSHADHNFHAMVCVGYLDDYQLFIARNSWGEDWGDQGYCYIPYDYFLDSDHCQDLWSIRGQTELDLSHDLFDPILLEKTIATLNSFSSEFETSDYYFEYISEDEEEVYEDEEEGYFYVRSQQDSDREDEEEEYFAQEEGYEYADSENYDEDDFGGEDDEDFDDLDDEDEDFDEFDLEDELDFDYDYDYDDLDE